MDVVLRFREDTRAMAEQILERGNGPGDVADFVMRCRGIERRIGEAGSYGERVRLATRRYVEDHIGDGVKREQERIYLQLERRVLSYLDTGAIDFSYLKRLEPAPLGGELDGQHSGYVADLEKRGMAKSTVVKWSSYSRRFMGYIAERGLTSLGQVDVDVVEGFVAWASTLHEKSGLAGELTMLRSLLAYSDSMGLTANARWLVPGGRYVRPAPVPAFTDEELSRLFSQVDNTTPIGKRNLAMMLLAIKMGMRSSEITSMLIRDVDWEARRVLVRQKKTRREFYLPAPDDVLDAIADYLLHGRPKSGDEALFLTAVAPFAPFARGCELWAMCKPYFDASGILSGKQGNAARLGLHRLRHTAATKMLAAEVPPESMASALGHAKIETTMMYVQVDEGKLRGCCLPLPGGDGDE